MTKNLAMAAAVALLVGLSGQAFARTATHARHSPEASGFSDQQAAPAFDAYDAYYGPGYAFDPYVTSPPYWPNQHRYQGGPKTDY